MSGQFKDLGRKGWSYLLAGLARPTRLPWLLWWVAARRAHAGTLLRLLPFRPWLRALGVRTVIDAGAHRGEFASAIRALLPEAEIYCFEPLADLCAAIPRRLGRGASLTIFPVALGERAREARFHRASFSKASSLLAMGERHREAFPWTAAAEPVTVSVRPLDDYREAIRFTPSVLLKIDVQGYELRVLEGAREILERVDCVLIESSLERLYQGDARFDEVYRHLRSRGFLYAGSWDQLQAPDDGAILQQDAFFVRAPEDDER